jgi:hypothetical protein
VFGAKAQRASLLGDFCNKIGTERTSQDDLLLVRSRRLKRSRFNLQMRPPVSGVPLALQLRDRDLPFDRHEGVAVAILLDCADVGQAPMIAGDHGLIGDGLVEQSLASLHRHLRYVIENRLPVRVSDEQ